MKLLKFKNFHLNESKYENRWKLDKPWIKDMIDYLEVNYPKLEIHTNWHGSGYSFKCSMDFKSFSIEERELIKKDILREIDNIRERTDWDIGKYIQVCIDGKSINYSLEKEKEKHNINFLELLERIFLSERIEKITFHLHQKVFWLKDTIVSEGVDLKNGEEWILDIVDNIELEYPNLKIFYTPLQKALKSNIYMKMGMYDKEDRKNILHEIFSGLSSLEEKSGMRIIYIMGSDLNKRDSKHIPPSYSDVNNSNYEESLDYISDCTMVIIEFQPNDYGTSFLENK